MSNKKKQPTLKGLTREQLKRIWNPLKEDAWLSIATEFKQQNRFAKDGYNTLKGRCINPDHEDRDPSFWIYADKHYAKCRGCGLYVSNPIQLVQMFTGFTVSECINYLKINYNIQFLSKTTLAELEEQRLKLAAKHEIYNTTHTLMCNAVAEPDNPQYGFAQKALDWLINTRKIPKDSLHALPIGIMPSLLVLKEHIQRKYQQQINDSFDNDEEPTDLSTIAYQYLTQHTSWDAFCGSVVFPLHATPSEIGRIKLRAPDVDSKNFITITDNYEDLIGLFGLGWSGYQHLLTEAEKTPPIYVTEGEMDVLSWMSRLVINNGDSAPFPLVSAGGVGSSVNIEPIILATGATTACLVSDAPKAQGDTVIHEWLSRIKELKSYIFTGWDHFPDSKDLDDIVQKPNGDKALVQALSSLPGTFFSSPCDWAVGQAQNEINKIDQIDLRTLIETAAAQGRCLKNRLDRHNFSDQISAIYKINTSLLMREISAREDSVDGFIMNCADALQQLLYVVGHSADDRGGRKLHFYNTKSKLYHTIPLASEKALKGELAPVGGRIVNFIQQHVGIPKFLEDSIEGMSDKNLTATLTYYLSEACLMLAEGAPDMATIQPRQGYHCLKSKTGETVEYIVCGSDVFSISRKGNDVSYTKLEGPADHKHGFVFDIGAGQGQSTPPWYKSGLTTELLDAQTNNDIKQIFKDLVKLYSVGYQFKHHNIMPHLIAASVLCFPITCALSRPIIMFITGDTNSGKTSLVATFNDRVGPSDIRLMTCAQGMESYTTASVAADTDNDSRLLVLDEFESDDPKKGEAVPGILEMYRGLVSGGTVRTKGQPGGGPAIVQRFKLPVVYSAIKGAARPQDVNRMIVVHMQKIEHRINPAAAIKQEFDKERIDQLTAACTIGMFQYAQEIAKREDAILKELPTIQNSLPVKIEWRYASALAAPLAVMDYVGIDWRKYLRDYVNLNTTHLQQMAEISESEAVLSQMLRCPVVPQEDHRKCSLAQLLASPEHRNEVNSSEFGTYYDSTTKLLLILLDTAIFRLIPASYRRYQPTVGQLKSTLDRHVCAISDLDIENSGILRKIGSTLGVGIQTKDVSVFKAERWLSADSELTKINKPNNGNKDNDEPEKSNRNETEQNSEDETEQKPDAAEFTW